MYETELEQRYSTLVRQNSRLVEENKRLECENSVLKVGVIVFVILSIIGIIRVWSLI